jgi:hypothetical protein
MLCRRDELDDARRAVFFSKLLKEISRAISPAGIEMRHGGSVGEMLVLSGTPTTVRTLAFTTVRDTMM